MTDHEKLLATREQLAVTQAALLSAIPINQEHVQ